jgi:hypothetical protein
MTDVFEVACVRSDEMHASLSARFQVLLNDFDRLRLVQAPTAALRAFEGIYVSLINLSRAACLDLGRISVVGLGEQR